MKVKLNVILNAPDDYSCGDCKKCPIHQESYFSTHQYEELKIYCPLGYNSVSCPLELVESGDEDADKKCTYKETGCGSCKRQLDCPIEADKAESEE